MLYDFVLFNSFCVSLVYLVNVGVLSWVVWLMDLLLFRTLQVDGGRSGCSRGRERWLVRILFHISSSILLSRVSIPPIFSGFLDLVSFVVRYVLMHVTLYRCFRSLEATWISGGDLTVWLVRCTAKDLQLWCMLFVSCHAVDILGNRNERRSYFCALTLKMVWYFVSPAYEWSAFVTFEYCLWCCYCITGCGASLIRLG